jgi:hypothetical protein
MGRDSEISGSAPKSRVVQVQVLPNGWPRVFSSIERIRSIYEHDQRGSSSALDVLVAHCGLCFHPQRHLLCREARLDGAEVLGMRKLNASERQVKERGYSR